MLKTVVVALMLLSSWPLPLKAQYVHVPFNKGASGFSDSFAYTGNLSSNWSGATTSFTAASGSLAPQVSFNTNTAWWSAGTFANDQYSCVTQLSYTSGNAIMPAVRSSASTGYLVYFSSGTFQLWLFTTSMLTSATGTLTNGHEYCLYVVGSALTLEDKTTSTTILTATDTTFSSGAAGINTFGDNTANTISHWRGGNGLP